MPSGMVEATLVCVNKRSEAGLAAGMKEATVGLQLDLTQRILVTSVSLSVIVQIEPKQDP